MKYKCITALYGIKKFILTLVKRTRKTVFRTVAIGIKTIAVGEKQEWVWVGNY